MSEKAEFHHTHVVITGVVASRQQLSARVLNIWFTPNSLLGDRLIFT